MRKLPAILAFLILAITTVVYAATLLSSYTTADDNDDIIYHTNALAIKQGMCFKTPNDGVSYTLDSAVFKLGNNTTGLTGTIYARLYSVTGTYGTNCLASTLLTSSASVDISTLSVNPTYTDTTFTFDNTYTMTPNTAYGITVTSDDLSASFIRVRGTTADGFAGNSFYFDTAWHAPSSIPDFDFKVYGLAPAAPPLIQIPQLIWFN